MKVGSLVVCIKTPIVPDEFKHFVKWLPVGDNETIYTIREIGEAAAFLEEGVIGIDPDDGGECGIKLHLLREIQPPMSLEGLMEEVEEFELFTV